MTVMKVGVISDTHDRLNSLGRALEIFRDGRADLIVHCGDWVSPFTLEYFDFISEGFRLPVKSVLGNNEGDIKRIIEINARFKNPVEFPPKQIFELDIGGQKGVIYHGQDPLLTQALIKSNLYDVVFTGHTHKVRNEKIGNTIVLNPGTTCFAVESRIINEASVAIYDSASSLAKIVTFR